jgi:hypothetical protein
LTVDARAGTHDDPRVPDPTAPSTLGAVAGRDKERAMHTVIRNYNGQPKLADELKKRSKDVEQVVGAVPGFIAYYLVKTSNGMLSVTVCEDKRGCDETSMRAADYLRNEMPELKVGAPEILEGDLLFRFANYKTTSV